MNYGNLVRRPFDIVARRPYLWLLGILAGGASTMNWSGGGNNAGGRHHYGTYNGPTWAQFQAFWNGNWEWIVALAVISAVLAVVFFALSCVASGSLVRAAVEHDAGRDYRLGVAWRAGYASGWRVAGLKLLVFLLAVLPAFLLASLVAGAFFGAANNAIGAAVFFGLFAFLTGVVALLFWLALSVAYQLALRMIVLEQGPVATSLSNGFRLIFQQFTKVGLGWLIMVGLSLAAGIAGAILAVFALAPAVALGFAGWFSGGVVGAVVAGSIGGVFAVGVLIAAWGAFAAYTSVYWTLFFQQLRGLPAPAANGAPQPA